MIEAVARLIRESQQRRSDVAQIAVDMATAFVNKDPEAFDAAISKAEGNRLLRQDGQAESTGGDDRDDGAETEPAGAAAESGS